MHNRTQSRCAKNQSTAEFETKLELQFNNSPPKIKNDVLKGCFDFNFDIRPINQGLTVIGK